MAREAEGEKQLEQCGACAWSCACACSNIPTANLGRKQWILLDIWSKWEAGKLPVSKAFSSAIQGCGL